MAGLGERPLVVVIGAGVSGLTSARCLIDRGYRVTLIAERFAPYVTSSVAGALWEWPPAICGHHRDQESLRRSKQWCLDSYERFEHLAHDRSTGVFMRQANFYLRHDIDDDAIHREKVSELARSVKHFRRDPGLIAENGVNPAAGLRDAYSYSAPMIDTDVYLRWLFEGLRADGCLIIERKLADSLEELASSLLDEFSAQLIVHCSGLGARELAADAMKPLRGALIRVRNDGKSLPRISESHCAVAESELGGDGFVFILPRGDDCLLLGGFAEPDQWELDVDFTNYEPIRQMFQRCVDFLPVLRDCEIDAAEPVRVGLRPYRERNVRLEHQRGTRVIHNYGHGGSGVTLSWGCAAEVARIADDLVR